MFNFEKILLNMEYYQINDLERLTGIKAHTIRIWEKRYNLIEPYRSETNIRYYDDEQVKKLLNVVTLLENGFKISKVSVLSNAEINKNILQIKDKPEQGAMNNAFINDLIIAMLAFDEAGFEKIFSAVVTRMGVYNGMVQVFYPFLKKTGVLWSASEAAPVQEHFASHLIRRKLMSAIDGLPAAQKKDKKFLLFLPENEWHEIALLFSDYIIRSKGYPTLYLGQNVPAANLETVLSEQGITHLLTFFITGRDMEERLNPVLEYARKNKSISLMISGNLDVAGAQRKEKNVRVLKTVDDLLKIL